MTREELLELAQKWEDDQDENWFENTPANQITWHTFIEGFKAGILYGFEKARETVETYNASGGYTYNHHRSNKYESAEQVIQELDNEQDDKR